MNIHMYICYRQCMYRHFNEKVNFLNDLYRVSIRVALIEQY